METVKNPSLCLHISNCHLDVAISGFHAEGLINAGDCLLCVAQSRPKDYDTIYEHNSAGCVTCHVENKIKIQKRGMK